LLANMSAIRPVAMTVDERTRAFAESEAPASAEKSGPALHATAEMRRLATPWNVALARSRLLAGCDLPPGILLDPACGSATQLAALCATLGRPGLGVELSGAVAPLAAVNLCAAGDWAEAAWGTSSRVLWGDGTAAAEILEVHRQSLGAAPPIALLHIDPARPADAQRHTLDEMEPRLDVLLAAWAPHLATEPALILDLSPRLSDGQREEVDAIVAGLWPTAASTWQWMTQGRGRIDRLSLWVGPIADENPARLLRLSRDGELETISGVQATSVIGTMEAEPGVHLTVVDPSLIASGLAESWRANAAPTGESGWAVIDGRRPVLLSEHPIVAEPTLSAFIRIGGEILAMAPAVDLDEVEALTKAALTAELGSLKLRCSLPPEIQPKLQSALDRSLKREDAAGPAGFIANIEGIHLICREDL
jgi:hypothetical protein